MTEFHRCAIYAAPAMDSEAWEAGSRWLGRCAGTGQTWAPVAWPGLSAAEVDAGTREPRRYGWHATLKAPFRPAPGVDLDQLRRALEVQAAQQAALAMPPMVVRPLGGFLAWVPEARSDDLHTLADRCVSVLQPLAAPLSDTEIGRRRAKGGLSPAQEALMLRWGYPFVFEHFRFHFSLTGDLSACDAPRREAWLAAASEHFDGVPPGRLDRLCLFIEPRPGADFVRLADWTLRP